MVNVMKGVLVRCDQAMKQFLLHLDETLKLGRKFIIQDLDENHLFISADILEVLQAKIDDLMDQISFPLAEKATMTISKSTLRGSNRIKEGDKRRVVDETSRKRRHRKVMELLESDNYHDDPHADLVMSKKIPKFDDNLEHRSTRTKKRERTAEYYQIKFRKNFQQLVDEDRAEAEVNKRVSYMDIQCEESPMPPRHFCAVCGFLGQYSCLSCGTRFCSIRCMDTHADTRCLKWAA